jgi:hypothetical protein
MRTPKHSRPHRTFTLMDFIWLVAGFLILLGIVAIVRGEVLPGFFLIFLGLLFGPGGAALFA